VVESHCLYFTDFQFSTVLIGIDLGKTTFHLVALDARGKVAFIFERAVVRAILPRVFPQALGGIEFWRVGRQVVLINMSLYLCSDI
jgi:hypothetical protein